MTGLGGFLAEQISITQTSDWLLNSMGRTTGTAFQPIFVAKTPFLTPATTSSDSLLVTFKSQVWLRLKFAELGIC